MKYEKTQTMNLDMWLQGRNLTTYQKALAITEYNNLKSRVKNLEENLEESIGLLKQVRITPELNDLKFTQKVYGFEKALNKTDFNEKFIEYSGRGKKELAKLKKD